ncbi:MAG TPA: GNAT family N-acetyltransferase [Thermoanaerobaculia bacterium]|nr:GNAT family N-acetyltransferase [Thermoanaerobaculia bacterium]
MPTYAALLRAVNVKALNHRERPTAESIRAIQLAAYSQEAKLLGVADFPPLRRSVDDLQASFEQFFGAYLGKALIGVVAIESTDTPDQLCISSLVVAPAAQRSGVGTALLRELLRRFPTQTFVVSTGVANVPALALYERFGFVELSRRFVGTLELVQLCRPQRSLRARLPASPSC